MTLTANIKNNSKIHHLTHLGFFQLCFYSVPGIKQVRNIISIDLNMYLTSCYMFLKIQLETSSGQTENILPHAATNKKGIFCSVGFCSLCQCISPHANQWKPAISQSKNLQFLMAFTLCILISFSFHQLLYLTQINQYSAEGAYNYQVGLIFQQLRCFKSSAIS